MNFHTNHNTDGANPVQIKDLGRFPEPMEMCNDDEGNEQIFTYADNGDDDVTADWVCIYTKCIRACYTIAIVY